MQNTSNLERTTSAGIAAYARTATDDACGTACQRQVRTAQAAVGPDQVLHIYTDAGRSGLDIHRPGLQRLRADVRRGRLRRVLVQDVARLTRNVAFLATLLDELRAAGVELVVIGKSNGADRGAPYGYRFDPEQGLAVVAEHAACIGKLFQEHGDA